VDFIIPSHGQALEEALAAWQGRAKDEAVCDYSFHCAVTYWDDKMIPEGMQKLCDMGISSFKVFMAYKGSLQVNDEEVLHILRAAKKVGAVTMAHCENADMVVEGQKELLAAGVTGPEGHYYSRTDECEAEVG
jgi:dihydropyrimidinase